MENTNYTNKKLYKIFGVLGLFVLIVIVSFSFFLNFYGGKKVARCVIPNYKLNQLTSNAAAPIKWVKVIDTSSINEVEHCLEIPGNASNINISLVSKDSIPKNKISVSNKLKLTDRQKFSAYSNESSQSAASLALADSLKNRPGFFANFLNTFTKLIVKMFAAVEMGTSTEETIVDLTATSSPIVEDLSPTASTPESNVIEQMPNEVVSVLQDSLVSISTTSEESVATTTVFNASSTPIEQEKSSSGNVVVVQYETPAPVIAEASTDTGKVVTVSADDTQDVPVKNVLAFTNIPEIYKVGEENKIQIKWQNNGDQNVSFKAYDLNGNGKLDYVEWTVPHLSTQTFQIIFISKALQLDLNKEVIADIYDQVSKQDNQWASIPDGNHIRVTFEQFLTSRNDNTFYVRPHNVSASIEIYPVYDGVQSDQMVAVSIVDHEGKFKVMLTELSQPTDTFIYKIVGGADIDYIVDPTPVTITEDFSNTSRIATTTNLTISTSSKNVSISTISDQNPPAITSFDYVSGVSIDTSDSDRIITVDIGVADDLSGVKYAYVSFLGPSGKEIGASSWDMYSGNRNNGVIRVNISIPKYSAQGTWTPNYVYIDDNTDKRSLITNNTLQTFSGYNTFAQTGWGATVGEGWLGDTANGTIFYIYPFIGFTGQIPVHGLIAAPDDQSPFAWGCDGTLIGGTSDQLDIMNADDQAFGKINTTAINNACPSSAASVCAGLNINGYTDWFLPSANELMELYNQRALISNYVDHGLWSSTEVDSSLAGAYNTFSHSVFQNPKSNSYYYRCVRQF